MAKVKLFSIRTLALALLITPLAPNEVSAAAALPLNPAQVDELRTEMKIALGALYAAEKSFQYEYHRYSTDLMAVGYFPEAAGGKMNFRVGFLLPFHAEKLIAKEDPRDQDNSIYAATDAKFKPIPFAPSAEGVSLSGQSSFCAKGCSADASSFEILAVARFKEGGQPEVWRINEHKDLKQMQVGAQ